MTAFVVVVLAKWDSASLASDQRLAVSMLGMILWWMERLPFVLGQRRLASLCSHCVFFSGWFPPVFIAGLLGQTVAIWDGNCCQPFVLRGANPSYARRCPVVHSGADA